MEGLPIQPEQADLVYDASKTGVRAWVWDIAFDKEDRPVIAYTRLPGEKDHRYHYARWDGKQWIDTELCAAGGWFPQTPAGKKESEPHYSSGLALDHSDPSIVYLTRPVNDVRELEKWTTADLGRTWTSEAVTSGSSHGNVRPIGVRGHAPDGPKVLWMNISDHYRHYTQYRC